MRSMVEGVLHRRYAWGGPPSVSRYAAATSP